MKRFWSLWSKALGEKAFEDDMESDKVALIRTVIILFYFTTNIFIISGIVRHWNGPPTNDLTNKAYHEGYKEALKVEKPSEELEIACAALWLKENDKRFPKENDKKIKDTDPNNPPNPITINTFLNR